MTINEALKQIKEFKDNEKIIKLVLENLVISARIEKTKEMTEMLNRRAK